MSQEVCVGDIVFLQHSFLRPHRDKDLVFNQILTHIARVVTREPSTLSTKRLIQSCCCWLFYNTLRKLEVHLTSTATVVGVLPGNQSLGSSLDRESRNRSYGESTHARYSIGPVPVYGIWSSQYHRTVPIVTVLLDPVSTTAARIHCTTHERTQS